MLDTPKQRSGSWRKWRVRDFVYDVPASRVIFGVGAFARLREEVERVGVFVDEETVRLNEIAVHAGLSGVQTYSEKCSES